MRRKLGSLIRCWNFTGDLVGVESESPKGLKIPVGRFFSAGSSTMVASVVDAPRTLNREELRLDNVTSNGRVVSSLELGPELYEISVVLKSMFQCSNPKICGTVGTPNKATKNFREIGSNKAKF